MHISWWSALSICYPEALDVHGLSYQNISLKFKPTVRTHSDWIIVINKIKAVYQSPDLLSVCRHFASLAHWDLDNIPIENNVSHLLLALPWWFSWPPKDICSAAQHTTSCQTWWGQAIKWKMRHFPYLSSSLSSTYLLLNLLLLSSTVKILDDIIFHLQCFSTLLSSITLVVKYQFRL